VQGKIDHPLATAKFDLGAADEVCVPIRTGQSIVAVNVMIISQPHPFHTQNQQFREIGESTVIDWGPSSGYHDCWYLDVAPR
jgi:hypothetical protein